MTKRFLWITLGACLIMTAACKQKKKGMLSVTGTFKNADKVAVGEGPVNKVYLYEITYGKDQAPVILDSAPLTTGKGSFTLNGQAKKEQQMYELMFGSTISIPLINDEPEIKVDIDFGKKDDFYEVSGSEASSQLRDLINIFGKKNYEVEKAMLQLDSVQRSGDPDSKLAATNKKNAAIQDLNTYLKQFINTSNNPTNVILALSWASRSLPQKEFELSLNHTM
ncbi:MAG: DUF4369 domain-containing protein, partial [Bacteroidetes bacterium]|nr:DUF4369 domain-containing protein [Bacteroidota bacterium]